MPRIMKFMVLLLVMCVYLALTLGCGEQNPDLTFIPEGSDGGHAMDWLPSGHGSEAPGSLDSCTECHGDALDGGISGVGCTICHIGSPFDIHPPEWGSLTYAMHNDYVETYGNASCSNVYCHGADFTGVPGSGPSCTSCHMESPEIVHIGAWGEFTYSRHDDYVYSGAGTDSCSNVYCHGADLAGVSESGPSCTFCHMGGIYSVHPPGWGDLTYARHDDYVESSGTASCAAEACHGLDLAGVPDSGPSCTSCHMGGVYAVHPSPYMEPYHHSHEEELNWESCYTAVCHGTSGEGVPESGPSCDSSGCHLDE